MNISRFNFIDFGPPSLFLCIGVHSFWSQVLIEEITSVNSNNLSAWENLTYNRP